MLLHRRHWLDPAPCSLEYNHHLMAIGWDLVCKSWCLVRVGPSECLIQTSVYGHWLQTSGPVLHDLVQRTMMIIGKRHMSRSTLRRHTSSPMAFPRGVDEEFTSTIRGCQVCMNKFSAHDQTCLYNKISQHRKM